MKLNKIAYIRSGGIYSDSRASKEILALLDFGYEVDVYGWDRKGVNAKEKCEQIFDRYAKHVKFWFYDKTLKSGQGVKNIWHFAEWMRAVHREINKGNYDAIHACDLDSGLCAYEVVCKKKIPLVYDIYDYYADAHIMPSFLRVLIERLEIMVINASKVTIICTEERRKQIQSSNPQQVIVIYNTPDVIDLVPEEEIYDYIYCGTLGEKRLLREILESYPEHKNQKFLFAGDGEYSQQASILANEFDNFEYLGVIGYKQVLEMEKKSKIISAIYEPSIRNHRLCAPNKFYEALALGKPIIVCKGTGIDQIVSENNIGIVINYDSREFYDAVAVLSNNDQIRKEMGNRARKLYDEKYNWKMMKETLYDTYDKIYTRGLKE